MQCADFRESEEQWTAAESTATTATVAAGQKQQPESTGQQRPAELYAWQGESRDC